MGLHPCRITIEAELETITPLHLGSGERAPDILGTPAADEPVPELALVVRDAAGRPFLPGSSLRGLLRRLAEAAVPEPAVRTLFGEIRGGAGGSSGQMGALMVRCGLALGTLPTVTGAPYARALADGGRAGGMVAGRTRIDPATGTAEHNKLFFQELTPAGCRFGLRLMLLADSDAALTGRLAPLGAVLTRLAEGAHLGKGQRTGLGELRLRAETVRLQRMKINAGTGEATWTPYPQWRLPKAQAAARGAAGPWALTLHCPGPFLIVDSSHRKAEALDGTMGATAATAATSAERRGHEPDDPGQAQLKAQRTAANRPLVLGSTILGALRSRAAWLCALDRHREQQRAQAAGGTAGAETLDRGDGGAGDRGADGGGAAGDEAPVVTRLFGTTDARGRLGLSRLRVGEGRPWNVTSVRLDRFSGAPIDQALFASATFVDVTIGFTLSLDAGTLEAGTLEVGPGHPDQAAELAEEQALAERLVSDIRSQGLRLGHGTNKGFGWFVEVPS